MIPVHKQGSVAFPKQIIRQQTFNTFLELRRRFKDKLRLCHEWKCFKTLMKNDIREVRKMFVLSDDSSGLGWGLGLGKTLSDKTFCCTDCSEHFFNRI